MYTQKKSIMKSLFYWLLTVELMQDHSIRIPTVDSLRQRQNRDWKRDKNPVKPKALMRAMKSTRIEK